MKETTVDSLVIARTLFERAAGLCHSEDRHLASAGLVLVQDALEMVFYALLIESDVDEAKNLEGKSFDELIGELKKAGVPVPKSGTMKALNKQRILTKHYAHVNGFRDPRLHGEMGSAKDFAVFMARTWYRALGLCSSARLWYEEMRQWRSWTPADWLR